MVKKRIKSEAMNDLHRLMALKDSEQSKLYDKMLRDKLSLRMKTLLTSQLNPAEIMALVTETRTLYEIITMVGAEEYALRDEIYRIEQEEQMEVEAIRKNGHRSHRMEGAI